MTVNLRLILCLISFSTVVVFSLINNAVSIIIFYLLINIVYLFMGINLSSPERSIFHIVFSVSIFCSIFLYQIYIYQYGTPYFSGGSDDLQYEILGQFLSSRMTIFEYGKMGQIHPDLISHNSRLYVYIISLISKFGNWFGGFHTLLPKIFNSGLLAWSAILAYRISKNKLNIAEKSAYFIALGSGLMPLMLFNSAHTFREIVIAFLLLLIVYYWLSYHNETLKKKIGIIVFSILVILLLKDLRSFTALGAGIVVLISWRRFSPRRKQIISILLLLFFFLGVILIGILLFKSGLIDQLTLRVIRQHSTYMQYRSSLAPGFTNFIFTPREPLGSILRSIFLMFSPYPRISIQPEMIFLSLGTIVQIIFIPFLIFGTYTIIRMRSSFPLWVMFWGFFIGEAAISFSWRHLAFFYPLGVILAGFGYFQWKKRKLLVRKSISQQSHQSV